MLTLYFVGKIWKPKDETKQQMHDDDDVNTEWDDILKEATEEELVDLAGKNYNPVTPTDLSGMFL